ncbi:MBOAT family O-acyltransferase [uncultured Oribacterium sp.]|jgi:hypothetical protein|uniref:MBOAT family O-acyltransferase n=1 Tax=uncultured Oribacterium sp. TaxID=462198 RepID=UPI002804E698|nr:MBOAT family O-acyltransferase [uncultured Oribacterium sp.]
MQFSQMIFVAGFLPLFCVLYFGKKDLAWKNRVFFLASFFFLLFQGLLAVVFLSVFSFFSFYMGKCLGRATEEKKKKIFFLSLLGIILPLAFFKYSGSLSILPKMLKGWMPFGISFYSFRFIAYLYDCFQGKDPEEDLFSFSLFAFAFPVLSQGPILRYSEIREEIKNREFSYESFSHGLFRFTFGLWKKLALADALGTLSMEVLSMESVKQYAVFSGASQSISFLAVFLSGLSYMLQIFLDFSSYTDMAIGLGEICGFSLPENFQSPYSARSIRDFWRRWHISLSMFFRDYVYIPLGGNRVPFLVQVRNLLLIWLLTGIWHGSTANFLLWGLYFFLFIMLELCCKKLWRRIEKAEAGILLFLQEKFSAGKTFLEKQERRKQIFSILLRCLQHFYTLVVLYFSWILFRFSDFKSLKNILLIHTFPKNLPLLDEKTLLIGKSHIFLLLLAILFSGNLLSSLEEEWQKLLSRGKLRLSKKKRNSLGFYGMEDSEEEIVDGDADENISSEAIGGAIEDITPKAEIEGLGLIGSEAMVGDAELITPKTVVEDLRHIGLEAIDEEAEAMSSKAMFGEVGASLTEYSSPLEALFPEEKYPKLKVSLDSEMNSELESGEEEGKEETTEERKENPELELGEGLSEELSGETIGEEEKNSSEETSLSETEELNQEDREDQYRHEKILRRIQRRTKLSIFFLDHAEQLYFWGKLVAAIAFLLLSFALMAGQSYMPFLYNQF